MSGRRPQEDRDAVEECARAGLSDRETSRRTGVPVNTIRTWRKRPRRERCPGCGHPLHDFGALQSREYSYLLGMYLGDGCLFGGPRPYKLRISLDAAYPGIIRECAAALQGLRGRPPHLGRDYRGANCVHVTSYWTSWACLLPQHGPGRKHQRPIQLTDWQRDIVRAHPEPFLRGLIHTDGWRGLNRVRAKGRAYEYPRYQFSNRSDDIRRLFCDACDLVGVEWRPWGRWHISVARRDSVARLDSFIGPKR